MNHGKGGKREKLISIVGSLRLGGGCCPKLTGPLLHSLTPISSRNVDSAFQYIYISNLSHAIHEMKQLLQEKKRGEKSGLWANFYLR